MLLFFTNENKILLIIPNSKYFKQLSEHIVQKIRKPKIKSDTKRRKRLQKPVNLIYSR